MSPDEIWGGRGISGVTQVLGALGCPDQSFLGSVSLLWGAVARRDFPLVWWEVARSEGRRTFASYAISPDGYVGSSRGGVRAGFYSDALEAPAAR